MWKGFITKNWDKRMKKYRRILLFSIFSLAIHNFLFGFEKTSSSVLFMCFPLALGIVNFLKMTSFLMRTTADKMLIGSNRSDRQSVDALIEKMTRTVGKRPMKLLAALLQMVAKKMETKDVQLRLLRQIEMLVSKMMRIMNE